MLRPLIAAALVAVASAAVPAAAGPVGPDVVLTVTPADVATAQTVTATVVARDDRAEVVCASVDWGDGTGGGVCSSGFGPGPSEVTYVFTHAYRRPGAWVVRATATSEDEDAARRDGTAVTLVRVRPGATPSNGPALPEVTPGQVLPPGGDRRTTYLDATARDEDGWVTETVVDWGDGTRSRQVVGRERCEDPLVRWPRSDAPSFVPSHRYARTGDRTVRVTTTSTGCDGQDRQTRTRTARVQVPARF